MSRSRYDRQIREKAVRLVVDHVEDYPREWAAIKAASGRLEMNVETLQVLVSSDKTPDAAMAVSQPQRHAALQ